jgi:hypothetical protein
MENKSTLMSSYLPESQGVAVATAPFQPVIAKPKLSPLAGLIASSSTPLPQPKKEIHAINHPMPPTQTPAPQAIPPRPEMRSTVYAAEKQPQSPWSKPSARLAAQRAVTIRDMRGEPQQLPSTDDGIEGVRELLVGSALNEIRTKVAELQLSLDGEIKRLRVSLMGRVDEMASALHRDMVCLRQETQDQMVQLKTDIFTAATTISGMKDHLHAAGERSRLEMAQSVAEIYHRMAEKETHVFTAMEHLQTQMSQSLESSLAGAMATLAKKSDVTGILDQLSLLISRSDDTVEADPFGFIPSGQINAVNAHLTSTDEEPMDVNDWFRVPESILPESGFLR